MSILVGESTRLIVQGITGREGLFHAIGCRDYGTDVVGGVTPGKGGSTVEGFPVWNSVEHARRESGDHGGGRRRRRADRVHHRGHPG